MLRRLPTRAVWARWLRVLGLPKINGLRWSLNLGRVRGLNGKLDEIPTKTLKDRPHLDGRDGQRVGNSNHTANLSNYWVGENPGGGNPSVRVL